MRQDRRLAAAGILFFAMWRITLFDEDKQHWEELDRREVIRPEIYNAIRKTCNRALATWASLSLAGGIRQRRVQIILEYKDMTPTTKAEGVMKCMHLGNFAIWGRGKWGK